MTQVDPSLSHETSLTNAMFLVAGTCIGGGMLALPVVSGQAGFVPTMWTMCLMWLAMTATALCLIELGLWLQKKNGHVISIAEAYLGRWGKTAAWILFLFMSYASIIAYIAGSGHLLAKGIVSLGFPCSKELGCLFFTLLFAPFIFLPHTKLAKLNALLFYAMVLSYCLLIAIGLPFVQKELLSYSDWPQVYKAIPLILTSFSFQTMVPSLPPLLGHSRKKLYIACIGGTSIALFIYLIWQWVILGAVPVQGPGGLLEAYKTGDTASDSLIAISNNPYLSLASLFFAFFALVTSFLGLGMGLFDFLADGCHIPKNRKGRVMLTSLVLIPSLLFAIFYERAFLEALDISGGFGDTLLNGIMPLLMMGVAIHLYLKKSKKTKRLLACGLVMIALLFALAFGAEIYTRIKLGTTAYENKAVEIEELISSPPAV